MLHYLWPRPKASCEARFCAGAMMVPAACLAMRQQWRHRLDDLAVAHSIAWFFTGGNAYLPRWVPVCVFGRLPQPWTRGPGRLCKTFFRRHAAIAQEQPEQRESARFP